MWLHGCVVLLGNLRFPYKLEQENALLSLKDDLYSAWNCLLSTSGFLHCRLCRKEDQRCGPVALQWVGILHGPEQDAAIRFSLALKIASVFFHSFVCVAVYKPALHIVSRLCGWDLECGSATCACIQFCRHSLLLRVCVTAPQGEACGEKKPDFSVKVSFLRHDGS